MLQFLCFNFFVLVEFNRSKNTNKKRVPILPNKHSFPRSILGLWRSPAKISMAQCLSASQMPRSGNIFPLPLKMSHLRECCLSFSSIICQEYLERYIMMRSKPQFNAFTAQMSLPDYSLDRGAHYRYEHIHYMQTLRKLSSQNSAKEKEPAH